MPRVEVMMLSPSEYLDKGADLSEEKPAPLYRFTLWRRWEEAPKTLLFVLYNPSTADDSKPDRTLDKCVHFAMRDGFGAVRLVNLFALRTPYPEDLPKDWILARSHYERNISSVETEAKQAQQIVVAWGQNETQGIDQKVLRLLRRYQDTYCLGRNKDQSPKHPLYLKDTTPIQLYLPRFEVQL